MPRRHRRLERCNCRHEEKPIDHLGWGPRRHYYRNEVHALDLTSRAIERLNNPSHVDNVTAYPEAYVDGAPSSRHSYGQRCLRIGEWGEHRRLHSPFDAHS